MNFDFVRSSEAYFWVDELTFSGGQVVSLLPGQLVVLVGPNNAGKSACLRELQDALAGRLSKAVVLKACVPGRVGDVEALKTWLDLRLLEEPVGGNRREVVVGPNGPIEPWIVDSWGGTHLSRELVDHLTSRVTAEARLEVTRPAKTIDVLTGAPSHPYHGLLSDSHVLDEVNRSIGAAFGLRLLFDRGAGETIPAYCVPSVSEPPDTNEVSPSYLRWLRSFVPLHEQGDGVRSFVGCVVRYITRRSFVTLIDEPEVFLHPPQARLLGRALATQKPTSRQVVVATHSADVLRGILDASSSAPRILRMVRNGAVNEVTTVPPDRLAELWKQPMLRYSNAIDALFHACAVLCEADADCRFYQWILEAVDAGVASDALFVPTGGKQKMPALRQALRSLGIPCVVICDIDLLRDRGELEAMVVAAGGNWRDIASQWGSLNEALSGSSTVRRKDVALREVKRLFQEEEGDIVSRRLAGQVREALGVKSGWDRVKQGGVQALGQGNEAALGRALIDYLAGLGVFLVPVGELERFSSAIKLKGGAWLGSVLSQCSADSDRLSQARDFIQTVASYLRKGTARETTAERPSAPLRVGDSVTFVNVRRRAMIRRLLGAIDWRVVLVCWLLFELISRI
jgi:hypothetical protein